MRNFKRNKISILLCAIGTLGLSGNALADDQIEDGWVAGFIEYYNPDSDKPEPFEYLDDGHGIGAELGLRFSPRWAGRIEWSHLDIDAIDGFDDETGDRLGVDALYFLDQKSVYLFAGVKHEKLDTSYRMANVGIGKHFQINDNWRVIAEAASYYDFGQDYNDFGLKLGIAYTFNTESNQHKAAAPTPPPPVTQQVAEPISLDTDGDGIFDQADKCPGTPKTDKVDANGCSILMEKSYSVVLNILFANNSSEITDPESPEFQKFADFMQRYGSVYAEIGGHTSAVGEADYNQKLSEERANKVRQLLIDRYDIDASRLTAKGYGETELLDDSGTAEAAKKNRRIHAKVSTTVETKVKR
ncbi:OmpA family protein [Neptunicella sp. SCSIO 80796]|uniref:OmpA family protein n=1 Tax=Neptunicella plasticusilytica TaxID=3117012 RepID=UPI003A4E1FF8